MSEPATALGAAISSAKLTTTACVAGIVRRPRSTFREIVRSPRAGALAGRLLVLLFVVPFAASAVLFSTDVGRQALVDQWENTALAFGQQVDDSRYEEFRELSHYGVGYAAATAFASGPLAAGVLALLIHALFTVSGRQRSSYKQVLAVVAAAAVILALRQVVGAPLAYLRETTASVVTLARLAPMMDQASPVARFLSLIDLFVIWWLVVLSIGLAVLYQLRTRHVAALAAGTYLAFAVVIAAAMAVLGGV